MGFFCMQRIPYLPYLPNPKMQPLMRTSFLMSCNKSFFVFLLTALGFFSQLTAQDISIGTGTAGNNSSAYPCPLQDAWGGMRAQYLYRASELLAAGMNVGTVSVIKFNITALNGAGVVDNNSIKIGTTAATTLTNTTWEAFSGAPVATPVANYTPVVGMNSFTLPAPFFWNGADNILVEVCSGNPVGGVTSFSNPTIPWTTGLSFNGSHTYRADGINGCGIATTNNTGSQTTRPNITFTWAPASNCTAEPVAGTVVSSVASTCGSAPFSLSLTGSSLAAGLTYKWQSSPNNTTWTDIPGATGAGYSTSQTVSTWYRAIVTCTFSGASSTTDALLVNATPLVAGTFTIDNSVPASTPTVFKSFNDAYNSIKCGINGPIVFNVVKNATAYNEQLIMNEVPGASATNTITFNGNGATINYLSTNTNERAAIKLNGADHITFDSLVINSLGTTSSQYGYGFHLLNGADSNTIKRCSIFNNTTLTSTNYAGIVLSGSAGATFGTASLSDGNTFDRNTIIGGSLGVAINGDAANPAGRNKITNNTMRDFYQYGVYMAYTIYTQVEGNNISRPNYTSSPGSAAGVYISNTTLVANIAKNRIHSFFDSHLTNTGIFYGIYFTNADADPGLENVVANNSIYNIKGGGNLYGLYNFGSNACFFYHNTVSFDDQASSSTLGTYGYYTTSYSAGVEFKNNIISITRSGAGLKYHFYMADERAALYTVDYNSYYSAINNPTIKQGFYKNFEVTTLAEWKTTTGFDANSVTIDPIFKNLPAGDLTPTSGTLNNKGTAIASVTTDINNTARSATTPDMGAYEYTLPSCNTNFQAGEAFSSVGNTTCVDKTVLLNLKNNDIGLGLTYQWETATSLAGTWTPLSAALQAPPYTFSIGNSSLYYRAAVACNGGTPNYSTPVQITIGGYFPAGSYTIDKTKPTDPAGTKNFNSFGEVVTALSCGIAGPVVFNVTPGTYTEQIKITEVPNTSAINTVTFQNQDGNPASAELTFAANVSKNYTVQLDSARHIIFRNMTISATDQTNGRVFDFVNLASHDSVLNCVIKAPVPLTAGYGSTTTAGIHAASILKGGHLVIKGNTFKNGSKGIYIVGYSTTWFTPNNVIENNTFENVYHQAIFAQNASGIKVNRNTIPMNTPYNLSSFNQGVMGIAMNNCDSAIEVIGNNITLAANTGYYYGIWLINNNGTPNGRGKILNNKIRGTQGITNWYIGLKNTEGSYADFVNNDIVVSGSAPGTSNSLYCAALHTGNAKYTNYYNNSLLNLSPGTGLHNAALWVDHQSISTAGFSSIYNNVVVNKGGGAAVFYNYTAQHLKIDYNLLYTSGSNLVHRGPASPNVAERRFANLGVWRQEYGVDMNSIVYDPAFVSNDNLQPDAANAGSWAMQGRGVQIAGNNVDFNGNARPTTLTAGVPDLGAYEFMPSVAPPALTATPAAPAAGTTQVFTMGTDTVTTITWDANAAVPSALTIKRYSGVLPVGLAATEKSLYYFLDADVTGGGPFKYNIANNFIDPWLNTLPVKSFIKMGSTNAANAWAASANSIIDSLGNVIKDTALTFADKFTGMTDGNAPVQQAIVTTKDSTNKGTRFWAPYGFSRNMLQSGGQQFKFVLAADVATEATVSINGTSYKKTYSIPAGGVITTDNLPVSGAYDSRLVEEGWSKRGILVESNNPISASALYTSGLTQLTALLLPTGTYTYDYTALGARQFSGYPNPVMGTSWVNVVADRDSTVVEITPSGITQGGRPGGVPFRVTLNRGEVYQILGGFLKFWDRDITGGSDNSYESTDLTGTKVVSVPNAAGECKPIAVFAGSGGTGIRCREFVNGADAYLFQQSYPNQAWGKQYLTAPLATRNSKNQHLFNTFRVLVKDPATVVKRNGVVMTGMSAKNFYEFTSRAPEFIEADKPIMIAQFMTYFNDCGNDEYSNPGSSESMFYLTPLGYGIKSANVYSKKVGDDFSGYPPSYTTVIVPDAGLASLTIAGTNSFDTTYAHPQKPGYTVVMRSWTSKDSVFTVQSDFEFTAIAHIPHNNGGYVYNVGYEVPRVKFSNSTIHNTLNTNPAPNTYTCAGTPFRATAYLSSVPATSITWRLSAVAGLTPSADVVQNNPVAVDTVEIDFKDYYVYTLNQDLRFAQTGTYNIPVVASYATSAASCGIKADTGFVKVEVIAAPVIDYTYVYTGCINATATFTGTGTAGNGAVVDRWNWNFGDNTTATIQNPTKTWAAVGDYSVSLQGIANDGCVNTATKTIAVKPLPTVALVSNSLATCPGGSVTFQVASPVQNAVYSWYNVATGGTALATGTSYTASNVPGATTYYVSVTQNGCDAAQRVAANVTITPNLVAPVVTVEATDLTTVRFRWNAVANATGYEVTTNGGTTWTAPSSGATGLTHLVSNLQPNTTVTIQVRALGGCTQAVSTAVNGTTTYSREVFIPNSFTPNGDGLNDVLKAYGTGIKSIRMMIFNQWGQKVFEGNDPNNGWDGKHNGKDAATGVYMYMATIVLHDGQELNKKGSINLIR
jgi:gliding motility-associated-like protein